ncbi:MAG: carbohydrate ABC transporter permease [Saccharofermentanales bacterium]
MQPTSYSTKESLRKRLKDSRASYLLMAPFMLFFTVLTVIPVVAAIGISFTYFNMLEAPSFLGFLNYERMFLDDSVFLTVIKNTLLFAFITGPISYFISFFSAWLINEFGPGLRSVFTLAFYAPVLSGNLYIIWTYLFSGDQYGMINSVLLNLGMVDEPVQWLSNPDTMMTVLIIVQLWSSLGVGFLAFIAGFKSLDKNLFEAASIDGVKNRWQELWYVTIPSMAPQLMFSAVMQIAASFGISQIIQTLAGFPTTQYRADTIVTYMLDVGTVRFEMGYASAIAVFLFFLMLLTNFVITHLLKRYTND